MTDDIPEQSDTPDQLAHLVEEAGVWPFRLEMEGATPIRPLRGVAIGIHAPGTERVPGSGENRPLTLTLALRTSTARRLAYRILEAVQDLENR